MDVHFEVEYRRRKPGFDFFEVKPLNFGHDHELNGRTARQKHEEAVREAQILSDKIQQRVTLTEIDGPCSGFLSSIVLQPEAHDTRRR